MVGERLVRIEWAPLAGRRPRPAGPNAHLEALGDQVRVPLARLALDDGSTGFGWSLLDQPTAVELVGRRIADLWSSDAGVSAAGRPIEEPLWDLVGRRADAPVYRLAAAITGLSVDPSPRVRCYDTTLYFDDLHLPDDAAAGELMAREALEGHARGHRAFKIKVGRGNLHLPVLEGLRRDVAVVRAIRAAVGPDCRLMADANNGYNLNLAIDFLRATADAKLFWLEEPFYEDPVSYRRLDDWLRAEGIATYLADGENRGSFDPRYASRYAPPTSEFQSIRPAGPSPSLQEWAERAVIDVVQYDIHDPGLTRWLELGPALHARGRLCAPHHYGSHVGNYVSAHLGPALPGFQFAEWDEAATPGLSAPGYRVVDGFVEVPDQPGFGLELDDALFEQAVAERGFVVAA